MTSAQFTADMTACAMTDSGFSITSCSSSTRATSVSPGWKPRALRIGAGTTIRPWAPNRTSACSFGCATTHVLDASRNLVWHILSQPAVPGKLLTGTDSIHARPLPHIIRRELWGIGTGVEAPLVSADGRMRKLCAISRPARIPTQAPRPPNGRTSAHPGTRDRTRLDSRSRRHGRRLKHTASRQVTGISVPYAPPPFPIGSAIPIVRARPLAPPAGSRAPVRRLRDAPGGGHGDALQSPD